MKKSLLVLATVAAFAAQAQTTDTLKKIKDSGSATMGVRESSGALSYTLGDGKFAGFHVEHSGIGFALPVLSFLAGCWRTSRRRRASPSSTSSTCP